ncbi:MAG: transporter [Gammaproteobacteria bacterium]|nr:transporter [Gammaproteobacteria bacterium]
MNKIIILAGLFSFTLSTPLLAEQKGIMFEYGYMRMNMQDMLSNTDILTASDITSMMVDPNKYMMAPTTMSMDMHMLMGMVDLTPKLGVMFMLPYRLSTMSMETAMGDSANMESSGLGDVAISTTYQVNDEITGHFEISVPTGSIDSQGEMMGSTMRLPYAMQLGSGTYDLKPKIEYITYLEDFTVGLNANYVFHLGDNEAGYHWGNKAFLEARASRNVTNSLIATLKTNYQRWGSIKGADSMIMQVDMMSGKNTSPVANPSHYGGASSEVNFELSYIVANSQTVGLDMTYPVYQNLWGPQMKQTLSFGFGYQASF